MSYRTFPVAAVACLLGLLPLALSGLASSAQAQGHGEGHAETATHADRYTTPTARWNALAREAAGGAGHGGAAPVGGRTFALVSVAQLRALEDPAGAAVERMAVARASADVLAALFPHHASKIEGWLRQDREAARRPDATALRAAEEAGARAAAEVIARARRDGSDGEWRGTLRTGSDAWRSAAGVAPVGTVWATVRPWVLSSADELRAPAPPVVGSPEFEAALEEVRRITRGLTEEQRAIAVRWMSPVDGYWNQVATDLIARELLPETSASRVLAHLNVAIMDAAITCFETKYHYQYPRPSHADATLPMAVPLPNFPAYVSGHSCVSGAAAEVLSHYFPAEAARVRRTADEIAMSRLYGGVHFRFDNDQGLAVGTAAARRVIERNPSAATLLATGPDATSPTR